MKTFLSTTVRVVAMTFLAIPFAQDTPPVVKLAASPLGGAQSAFLNMHCPSDLLGSDVIGHDARARPRVGEAEDNPAPLL